MPKLSRRRFLALSAAAGGLSLLPRAAAAAAAAAPPLVWQGLALGARASLTLYHPDPQEARDILAAAQAEIARLESVFSLYRADSAISRLNRDGRLDAPPPALLQLLSQTQAIAALTEGAFDPTVQPLWRLYAAHFAAPGADPAGPPRAALERALASVDHRALRISPEAVGFERPGMAITLNGIAQGFITDRVAALLRRRGLERVLVDLGEQRALGPGPAEGRPWRAGILDPSDGTAVVQELDLQDRALATSAGAGTLFEPSGRHHHLFDPRSGLSSGRHASVSVLAPTASLADGLSTACSNLEDDRIAALCRGLPEVEVYRLDLRGKVRRFSA